MYNIGGEGIMSLDAGAPSIKYEGDIKPKQEVADVNLPLDVQGWFQSLPLEQQIQLLNSDIDEAYKTELRKLMGEAPDQQGIMNAVPREKALLGGLKKAVSSGLKKVGNVIGDVVSSDIGKAALLATAGAYGLGMGPFAAGSRFGNVAGAGFLKNIGLPSLTTGKIGEMFSGSNLLKAGTLLGGSALMTKLFGSPQQAAELYSQRPQAVNSYLDSYYRQVNPKKEGQDDTSYEQEVADFVSRNTAEYKTSDTFAVGGRVGYSKGTDRDQGIMELKDVDPNLRAGPDWYLKRIEALMYEYDMDYETAAEIAFDSKKYFELMPGPQDFATGGRVGYSEGDPDPKKMEDIRERVSNLIKQLELKQTLPPTRLIESERPDPTIESELQRKVREDLERRHMQDVIYQDKLTRVSKKAYGGRMMKALGDTAQMASGIAGLPLRQNPMGTNEIDLRDTGGFIPPVGVKEKADDIPAMLSNNEFVFTADAVRGMGNGDVNKGAQRMYDMMKRLENGGRV